MKISKALLCFLIVFENVTNVRTTERNRERSAPPADILNELVAGPLRGKAVTLVLEAAAEQDEFIRNIQEPFTLLWLPSEMPAGLFGLTNVTGGPGDLIREFSLRPSVVVMVLDVDDPFWWPLFFPPDEWEVKTVVFISSSPSYSQDIYFKSPLMHKPSSAILLCPGGITNDSSTSPLEVWSWTSFAGRTNILYRGIWNPETFQSWDRLFVASRRDAPLAPPSRISGAKSYASEDGRDPPRSDHYVTDAKEGVQYFKQRRLLTTRSNQKGNTIPLIGGEGSPVERTYYRRRHSLITSNQTAAAAAAVAGCLPFVVAQWDPFVSFQNYTPPYVVNGATIDLVNIIAKHLGICYRLVRAKDNDWGTVFPNGTWTGSLGLLNRGEVVMSVTPYSVSLQRAKAVDFSEPVYMDELSVGYQKHQLQSDIAAFTKPYTLKTWMCIIGSLLVITPTMVFLRLFQHNDSRNPNARQIRFSPTVWPLCCLIDQASIWEPQHNPVRVAGCLWVAMAFIVSCVYRSTLFAMLITPKVQLPFNSFEELAKTDIAVWAPTGSRFQDAVEAAPKGSKLAGIKKNMVYSNNSIEGTELYIQGKWGFGTTRQTLIYQLHKDFTDHGYCRQYIMDDGAFKPTPLSLAFPKGSTFKPTVDRMIRNLKESGIIEHLYKQRVLNATSCLHSTASGFTDVARPLFLYNFYGVFSVYMGGMILGSITFLLEILTRANFTRNL